MRRRVQPRVLSAARPGCPGAAGAHGQAAARRSEPRFQRHLRRRRLHARRHAGRVRHAAAAGLRRRRISRASAPPATTARDPGQLSRTRRQARGRAARRHAVGHGRRGRVALCQPSWCASSARKPATGSTSRSPPIPKCIRRPTARRTTCSTSSSKMQAGADSAITQYFFNADAYFDFVDRATRQGHPRADRAGHHADHQLHASWRASRTCAAPRSRAGSACGWQSFGDDKASIRAFGLDVVTELCQTLLDAGAPACISIR